MFQRQDRLRAMKMRRTQDESEGCLAACQSVGEVRMLARARKEEPKSIRVLRDWIDERRDTKNAAFFELLEWLAIESLGDGTATDYGGLKGHQQQTGLLLVGTSPAADRRFYRKRSSVTSVRSNLSSMPHRFRTSEDTYHESAHPLTTPPLSKARSWWRRRAHWEFHQSLLPSA